MAWEKKVCKKFDLQKELYSRIQGSYRLSAQKIVRCLSEVADAYKAKKEVPRTFRPYGSIAYDARILSHKTLQQTVSIWTTSGRQAIP